VHAQICEGIPIQEHMRTGQEFGKESGLHERVREPKAGEVFDSMSKGNDNLLWKTHDGGHKYAWDKQFNLRIHTKREKNTPDLYCSDAPETPFAFRP
jgi:hypothetical protein